MNAEESGKGAWQVFKQDLAAALRAWRRVPLLPVLSVALTFVPLVFLPAPAAGQRDTDVILGSRAWLLVLMSFPLGLFAAGWVGTERIWYLRAYRGRTMRPKELLKLTWAFVWRYFLLALLVIGVPMFVIFIVVMPRILSRRPIGPLPEDPAFRTAALIMFLWYILADVILTFVTPALAYSTRRVGRAFGIGLRMLRTEWPRSAGYTLVPPLALLLGLRTLPESVLGRTADLVLSVAGVLLNLWFKGATAAFYLRRHSVGDDGSAFSAEVLRT